MRKVNAILSAVILALFALHGVLGTFQLLDAGTALAKGLSHTLLTLAVIHALIGVKLTFDSVRVWRRTGAPYLRQNALFWARRLSGLAIMVLIAFHATAFSYTVDGAVRLHWFTPMRLAVQLLFVAALAVHIVANVKPMLIAFGVRKLKPRAGDILFILSALLLLMAA
ncbi:MAG: pilus assembly protein PilX, partial [Clostridia bacterium]|nr:pilus assembly protein PilX [Clostridia bacterium]